MLNHKISVGPAAGRRRSLPSRQRGVVLMIALIILVALMMGGLALVRSVGTTNIIAGNLAFQQSATQSSQAGTEAAITTFLAANEADTSIFHNNNYAVGYAASVPPGATGTAPYTENPATAEAWDTYWTNTIAANRAVTLPIDAAGNTVSYTIQRLCQATGDPLLTTTGCASGSQQSTLVGASLAAGSVTLPMITQYYYRITTRTVGPRNTVSYVQTIVAK